MAIVGAILLLVTLVALGGYFLYRSLPNTSTSISASSSDSSTDVGDEDMGALYVHVTGESSRVFVRVPGGEVLHDQVIEQGRSIAFHDAEDGLEVTIGDPAAVDVYVEGAMVDLPDEGEDHNLTVPPTEDE
ncbi:RodZ domain-containing protein [Nocardiopsis sp. LOL_012]|uniref:RodZ domain-containing protein n=1 Tax=Nocardiopsis sp. LOL_012 TaxID=3345409 RepID=UPI003A8A79A6